jgi:hypothetical protein
MTVHKATPHPRVKGEPQVCFECLQPIRIVPGGHGPTWVHDATGAVVGNDANLVPEAIEAADLIREILKDADWMIPRLITLLAHNDLVPGDDTDDETLAPFLERLTPMVTNVLNLRMLSLEPRGYVQPVMPPRAENERPTS